MPTPVKGERTGAFVSRYVSSPEAAQSFPDQKQRLAVAYSIARQKKLAGALRKPKS